MAYHRLDVNGKPIKPRSRQKEAERIEGGKSLYHYAIIVALKQDDGKYKHIRRHAWLPGDAEAEEYQRGLLRKPSTKAMTWEKAHEKWLGDVNNKKSIRHLANVAATIQRWIKVFGSAKTIEDTTLGEFSEWILDRSKTGKGRGAQLDYAHLIAIAKWNRKRGFVTKVPFEFAPKPASRTQKREAAARDEFHQIADALPKHISLLWQLLGMTGMRLGAACGLLEADIGRDKFTVTTKGSKRVTYPITPPVTEIITQARLWRSAHGFTDKPYLFCNIRGEPWNSRSIGGRIKAIIDKNNKTVQKEGEGVLLPSVTSHQLRHMAGTILGEQNLEVPTIMAALGHANPASSQVYIDKTQKMRNEAMNVLIKNLSKNDIDKPQIELELSPESLSKPNGKIEVECPCCHRNVLIILKKKA